MRQKARDIEANYTPQLCEQRSWVNIMNNSFKNHRPKPMREFVDRPHPQKRPWIPANISLFLYFTAPLLIIPCVYLVGNWVVGHYYSTSPTEAALRQETGTASLGARQADAIGGVKPIDELDQLKFKGTAFIQENWFSFEGSSSLADGYVVSSFDSGSVIASDQQGASKIALPLQATDNPDVALTRLQSIFSHFEHLAGNYLLEDFEQLQEPLRDGVHGDRVVFATVETEPGISSKLYFDERTMELVTRKDEKEGELIATYQYSDYKDVSGLSLPHRIVAKIEGIPELRVEYTSITVLK